MRRSSSRQMGDGEERAGAGDRCGSSPIRNPDPTADGSAGTGYEPPASLLPPESGPANPANRPSRSSPMSWAVRSC